MNLLIKVKLVYVCKHVAKQYQKKFLNIKREQEYSVKRKCQSLQYIDFMIKKLCYRVKAFYALKGILIIHYFFIQRFDILVNTIDKIKLLPIIVEL